MDMIQYVFSLPRLIENIKSRYALKDHSHEVFSGATLSESGEKGLVPVPTKDDVNKYLKADGTWAILSDSDVITSDDIKAIFEGESEEIIVEIPITPVG